MYSPVAKEQSTKLIWYLKKQFPADSSVQSLSQSSDFSHILEVASQLLTNNDEMLKLMRGCHNSASPIRSQRSLDYSLDYSSPSELLQMQFDREKAKLQQGKSSIQRKNKLVRTKWKTDQLKLKKYERKIKRIQEERQKKLDQLGKLAEDQRENRLRHLEAKRRIVKKIEAECQNYGERLELRMNKLNEQQKEKLRAQMLEEQRAIKEHIDWQFKKREITAQEIHKQEQISEESLKSLLEKQEKRIKAIEQKTKQRAQIAREHSCKVNKVLSSSLNREKNSEENKLKKILHKFRISEGRVDKKEEKIRDSSIRMRDMLNKSFDRQNSEMRKVNREIQEKIKRTVKRISHIEKAREKAQEILTHEKANITMNNSHRATTHAEKHKRILEERNTAKEKILEKQLKMFKRIDEYKKKKQDLSHRKRLSNFELRNFRNLNTISL